MIIMFGFWGMFPKKLRVFDIHGSRRKAEHDLKMAQERIEELEGLPKTKEDETKWQIERSNELKRIMRTQRDEINSHKVQMEIIAFSVENAFAGIHREFRD
jgi:hypothetical protein